MYSIERTGLPLYQSYSTPRGDDVEKKKKRRRRRSWNNIRRWTQHTKTIRTGLGPCVIPKRFQSQMRWKSAANWRGDVAQVRQLASPVCCINNGTLRQFGDCYRQPLVRNSPRWRTEVRRFLLKGHPAQSPYTPVGPPLPDAPSALPELPHTGEVCVKASSSRIYVSLQLRQSGEKLSYRQRTRQ